jgi:hypothetical protein
MDAMFDDLRTAQLHVKNTNDLSHVQDLLNDNLLLF